MSEVTLIGIDLAKRVFQLHGARSDGSIAFRKKLSLGQLFAFVSQQSHSTSEQRQPNYECIQPLHPALQAAGSVFPVLHLYPLYPLPR